jgi:hypothetical protein
MLRIPAVLVAIHLKKWVAIVLLYTDQYIHLYGEKRDKLGMRK